MLLLTLVILALAATVTAGVCRSSLAKAARAVRAGDELQRRWGALSCKRAFLPKADEVLAAAEAARGGPLAACQARLMLGGQAVDLVFADESAKLNVNDLVRRRGKVQAEAVVAALVREAGGGGGTGASIRTRLLAGKPQGLRPKPSRSPADAGSASASGATATSAEDDDEPDARPLQSFGQVFPDAIPAALFGSTGRPGASAFVTCWGEGTLHVRRASDAVLARACTPPLTSGQAARLVRLRQQSPAAAVEELLLPLKLTEDDEADVEDRLTDESSCHSLWVVTTAGGRSWYLFAVADGSAESEQDLTFSW